MKAQKSKPNKIDRGHEIPSDDNDCDRTGAYEENEDWRNGSTKEVQKIIEYEFREFYPKDWSPSWRMKKIPTARVLWTKKWYAKEMQIIDRRQ